MSIAAKLLDGMEVGVSPLPRRRLDGDPAPPQKGSGAPLTNFRPMSIVAGWINILLGTEVGFDPGDLVLDGDPAPLP